ncbi:hypothetical protein HUN41_00111 [Streptomyces phage Coruscant]|uniref:Uncharacterized protein n=1 Tax=Streptomyces phage Coruscant TaxID=2739834 RepID=A0A7G4AW44_9CAUD|nr:hypothetical protein PP454_gp183 [Streptomyces phage Coruscant]QMP84234.1 hypothetical protein HUN41_00111 [Streptomyces phage Coruscant]
METFMVGPVVIWVIWSIFLVKKKGRQWPELFWGLLGGLILAKVMPDLPGTVFDIFDKIWDFIASIFSSISQGL